MIVVSMTDVPNKVRGDLSKWLLEIDTGVYVGNLSARVRELLWEKIVSHIGSGRAVIVWSSNNEQGFDFEVCGNTWVPVDMDGIKLMLHTVSDRGPSKAVQKIVNSISAVHRAKYKKSGCLLKDYTVIDVETSGLNCLDHDILEIAALKIRDHNIADTFTRLIRIDGAVPPDIVRLTGITDSMLQNGGCCLSESLSALKNFIGSDSVAGYNISFDMKFLKHNFSENSIPFGRYNTVDILDMARRLMPKLSSYELVSAAQAAGIKTEKCHRAYDDCLIAYNLYESFMQNLESSEN